MDAAEPRTVPVTYRPASVIGALAVVSAACGGQSTSTASGAQGAGSCALIDGLALSPRDDADAEQLAFESAGTLSAPTDVYTRIHDDLVVLRQSVPELASIHARPRWSTNELVMHVDDVGFAAISNGTYTAWDCANAKYGVSDWTTTMLGGGDVVILNLGHRRLNIPIVADAYASLPNDTRKPEPSSLVGDASNVCVSYVGDTYSYVFKKGDGDCPSGCTVITLWGFSTKTDGTVTTLGKYGPGGPGVAPAWLRALPSCAQL
jgi:hypothetical protein